MSSRRVLMPALVVLALVLTGCAEAPEEGVGQDPQRVGDTQNETLINATANVDTPVIAGVQISKGTTRVVEAELTFTDARQSLGNQTDRKPFQVHVVLFAPNNDVLDKGNLTLPDPSGLEQDVTVGAELTGNESWWNSTAGSGTTEAGVRVEVEDGPVTVVGRLRSYGG